MTLAQAKVKLKAARADNRRKNQLLVEVANYLTLRQIAAGLVGRIKAAVNGGK